MFGFRFLFLYGVLAISLTSVHGLSDEEKGAITGLVVPFMAECGKKYGVTEQDMNAAKKAGTFINLPPCFLSCLYKKVGLFTSKGLFDVEKSTALAMNILNGGAEQQNALKVIHVCASVNDKTVGDGDKGCERAKMFLECYMPLKGTLPSTL